MEEKTNKNWRVVLSDYADEWVSEGVKLLKRLQLAVLLIALGWLIFSLGALAALIYLVVSLT